VRRATVALLALVLSASLPTWSAAQGLPAVERRLATFQHDYPELYAVLVGTARAHGVLYGELARARGRVREAATFERMTRRTSPGVVATLPDSEAEAGYAALGARGAEVIRRTQGFHLEVLAILATADPSERKHALDEAADRYLSRPEVSLPDVPKDMTILYDHPYSSIVVGLPGAPKRKTPRLKGLAWAAAWLQLAAEEPLELSTGVDRARGLKVVTDRFRRKQAYGAPPHTFPSELPLAPSIAPELVTTHPRTAAILDNLNMMHAVLADVLESPKVGNVRAALDEVIAHFTSRTYRVVDEEDWIRMALRHSIFEQGGPAIGVMTISDRNGSGHLQHLSGGRGILPGMK
jgi:CheY-like chemotaxis protein